MTTDRSGPDGFRPDRFRPNRLVLRLTLALSGWLALAATALPGGSPLRWVPVLLFVILCPGLALLHPQRGPLRPVARIEAVALAAPLSLSLGVTAATTLFLARGFSATAFLVALAAVTTVAAALPGLPLPAATRGAAGHGATGKGATVDSPADHSPSDHSTAEHNPADHSADPDPGRSG